MSQGEDGGGDEPRQAEQRAHRNRDGYDEQVEMVAVALLHLKLLSVDDDGGDLLIHEHENGGYQGRYDGQEDGGDRVLAERADEPATRRSGRLELGRYGQLLGAQAHRVVYGRGDYDRDHDRKVAEYASYLFSKNNICINYALIYS